MSEQPDLSTLPKRMRYAADVIEEAAWRNDPARKEAHSSSWSPDYLRDVAELWEQDDAKYRDLVDELSKLLRVAAANDPLYDTRVFARHLIDSGWRKADPA